MSSFVVDAMIVSESEKEVKKRFLVQFSKSNFAIISLFLTTTTKKINFIFFHIERAMDQCRKDEFNWMDERK